jgi:glucosylceramidase
VYDPGQPGAATLTEITAAGGYWVRAPGSLGPNAKRVSTTASRSQLLSTSFLNKDGKIITVVMNQSDEKIKYNLYVGSNVSELEILPHAIQTLVY